MFAAGNKKMLNMLLLKRISGLPTLRFGDYIGLGFFKYGAGSQSGGKVLAREAVRRWR